MSSVISVENLSKKYIIGHQKQERYTALRDVLANGAKRFTQKLTHPFAEQQNDPTHEEFWALKDVSFDVQQGDRVGIIGRNGAGKSTLLKILSRITEPTSGKVSIRGRVASLLEVGTGFHPELTGRENIFLNGAILGMSKVEIKSKFDEIVAFAEVEKFLDTPVKRYSSGMYVRLAFAVAAHLEPEILIVDEVLAVGDAQFQKKCLGKMQDVGQEGRTVLFVSHNMAAVELLCTNAIFLKKGEMVFQGGAREMVEQYLKKDGLQKNQIHWDDTSAAPQNERIRLIKVMAKPALGDILDTNSVVEIGVDFYNKIGGKPIEFALRLFTIGGICLFTSRVHLLDGGNVQVGRFSIKCKIPPRLLNAGGYKMTFRFIESGTDFFCSDEDILAFDVEYAVTGGRMHKTLGLINPDLQWMLECSP